MKIRIKKLHPDAVIPKYATDGAAGFDLVALEDTAIDPGETKLVKTGLSIDVGFGYQLEIRPRSGLSLRTPLRVAFGTIDEDYRGEIGLIVSNTESTESKVSAQLEPAPPGEGRMYNYVPYQIKKGDRLAQGVVMPAIRADIEVVDELSVTQRGTGGFGSTGK